MDFFFNVGFFFFLDKFFNVGLLRLRVFFFFFSVGLLRLWEFFFRCGFAWLDDRCGFT